MQEKNQSDPKSTNDVNSESSPQEKNVVNKEDKIVHHKRNPTPSKDGNTVANKNGGVSSGKKRSGPEENKRPLL